MSRRRLVCPERARESALRSVRDLQAFLELSFLHLAYRLLGLVIFYSTFNLPFGVFVMRNTFSQIPAELEESAQVDGSGTYTTLWRVMRPLVSPDRGQITDLAPIS